MRPLPRPRTVLPRIGLLGAALITAACSERAEPTPFAAGLDRVGVVVPGPATNWVVAPVEPIGTNRVNTPSLDGCPIESPDGRQLFIASNRPGGQGQIDIWAAGRDADGAWGEPRNVGAPVNGEYEDFCPTPLTGGGLMFVSRRPNEGVCHRTAASTDTDIYLAYLHPTRGWSDPEHLGCLINSAGDELSPAFVAAGGGMLFFSSDRGSPGQHRIYVSMPGPLGTWGAPQEVAELNAGGNAFRPNVSHDGRVIVFDSSRPGGFGGPDVWMATRQSPFATWSAPFNLGPAVNSEFAETRGSLTRDSRRLHFGSNRPGGMGSTDVYVATRS